MISGFAFRCSDDRSGVSGGWPPILFLTPKNPVNLTFLGKGAVVEMVDLRTLRSDRPGPSGRAPNPVTSIFISNKRRHRSSEERPGYRLTAEAKIRETQPPAEECPRPPGAGRGKALPFPPISEPSEEAWPWDTLTWGVWAPRCGRGILPSRAAVCADLRQRLREGRAGARCPASPCPGQSRSPRVSFGVWTAAVPDDGGGSQPGWLVSLTQSVSRRGFILQPLCSGRRGCSRGR